MFTIAGATGNTGAVVATTLLAAKAPVRVIVRDAAKATAWRERGAEIAVADVSDLASLTAALRGSKGAYLLVPPRPSSLQPLEDNRAVVDVMAAAVKAAEVPHVVLLSSIAAQQPDGTGPIRSVHYAEAALAKVSALTAVRAAYFMENWMAALGALAQGILPTFLPANLAIPMVATKDIGLVSASALLEGPHGQTRIELSGPQSYSSADVAAVVGELLGKPGSIVAAEAPLEAVVPTFTSFGVSAPFAELFREMYAGIRAGHVAWEGGAARAVRGTVPIADVLRPALKR